MTAKPSFKEIVVQRVTSKEDKNCCYGVITLNRPTKGNSLTAAMSREIIDALNYFDDRRPQQEQEEAGPPVRIIVFTANGKYFCTGADLSSAQSSASESTSGSGSPPSFVSVLEAIKNCQKPTMCIVNGPVMGGGVGLVFATDLRIVSSEAYFSFPEVKRGLIPAMISAFIVPQLGIYKSKQFMMTGQKITAEEMMQLGVVTSIYKTQEELTKQMEYYISELIGGGPKALYEVKKLVDHVASHNHEDNKKHVAALFSQIVQSEEATYGITCFLQKQKPDWSSTIKQAKL